MQPVYDEITRLTDAVCRAHVIDENPMAWMVTYNGLIMDVRTLPREVQEEAYRKGRIPYLPGQREK